MAMIWFCSIKAGGKGFIRNKAEERRYKEALFRMSEKELAKVMEYSCHEGKMLFVIECQDRGSLKRIIKNTNASYGKYMKFMGEDISFDAADLRLLKKDNVYVSIKQQFFNTFYVAEKW